MIHIKRLLVGLIVCAILIAMLILVSIGLSVLLKDFNAEPWKPLAIVILASYLVIVISFIAYTTGKDIIG